MNFGYWLRANLGTTVSWAILIATIIFAFLMEFYIGGNDVANSFGISVGAGTLSETGAASGSSSLPAWVGLSLPHTRLWAESSVLRSLSSHYRQGRLIYGAVGPVGQIAIS